VKAGGPTTPEGETSNERPAPATPDGPDDLSEDQVFRAASVEQLQEIFAMKRLLVGMRKAVTLLGVFKRRGWF
jgi:hypothetical protein